MISLKVMDICGNCPYFKAETHEKSLWSVSECVEREVVVSCNYEKICQRAMKEILIRAGGTNERQRKAISIP